MAGSEPQARDVGAHVRDLLRRVPLVDGHNDLPWQVELKAGRDLERIDLFAGRDDVHTDIPRLRRGGLGAQFWAAYVPCDISGDAAVVHAFAQVDLILRMQKRWSDAFAFADTADDVESIHRSGRIASLIGIEGGHSLGHRVDGDPVVALGVLRMLRRCGARYLTLTHNDTHSWADSATDQAVHDGLSEFGERVVREMNRIGMLVDLSHVAPSTMRDALRVSSAPVVFTHSSARALCDHVRNVPDEILERVAQNGGTVMVTFVPSFVNECVRRHWSLRREIAAASQGEARERALADYDRENQVPRAQLTDVVDHIEHVARVAGIDHVGIGGDFDGIQSVPVGLEDVSKYHDLFVELVHRGFSDEDCEKIAGRNILRTLRRADEVAKQEVTE